MQPPIVLNGGAFNDSWEWKNDSGILISTNQEFKLLQVRNISKYRFTCFGCDWDSKTFKQVWDSKQVAEPRKRRTLKWIKRLKSLIQLKTS